MRKLMKDGRLDYSEVDCVVPCHTAVNVPCDCGVKLQDICGGCGTYECVDRWECWAWQARQDAKLNGCQVCGEPCDEPIQIEPDGPAGHEGCVV